MHSETKNRSKLFLSSPMFNKLVLEAEIIKVDARHGFVLAKSCACKSD